MFATQISIESIQSDHTEVNSNYEDEPDTTDSEPHTESEPRIEPLLVLYQQEYMMQESSDSTSPSEMSEGKLKKKKC